MPPAAAPPAPLTLVVGPEELLAERAVAEVLAAARAVDPTTERRDVDAGSVEGAAALAEALSPTLFGEAAVVVVTGVEGADDAVADILRRWCTTPEDRVWCVAVHPGGVKGKAALESWRSAGAAEVGAEKVKGRAVDDFLVREMRRHRRRATPQALAGLRAALGDDLRALASACSQLADDVESDPIDLPDVQRYHEGVAGVSGFAVSDSVWAADPVAVLVALRWALDSDPAFGPAVVATTANGLRALLRLAGAPVGIGQSDLAREVGVPAWKLRTLREELLRWPPRALAQAAVLLARADVAVKGGADGEGLDPVQKRVVLERTLLTIARSRRSAG